MSSPSKRREMDLMKLMMSDYKVEMMNDGMQEFYVDFHGPSDSIPFASILTLLCFRFFPLSIFSSNQKWGSLGDITICQKIYFSKQYQNVQFWNLVIGLAILGLYQGGVWRIRVELPDAYPYKSPSIGFVTKIYHPNVDETSGSVCLDVINQTWSPMFDLVNVFEVFLPQLLLYPNPSDPLNGDAASLMMRDKASYELKVKEYCEKYAKPEDVGTKPEETSSDEELSEEENDSGDDSVVGKLDP